MIQTVSTGSRRLAPLTARAPAHRRGLTLLPSARSGPGYAGRAAGASTVVGKKPAVAGAVGSTALGSHFGASLEDHGPNVVLYRAGPQTARRAGSLRGHDHSHQSSATPKPLHRPISYSGTYPRRDERGRGPCRWTPPSIGPTSMAPNPQVQGRPRRTSWKAHPRPTAVILCPSNRAADQQAHGDGSYECSATS